jgi:hypothetical protein
MKQLRVLALGMLLAAGARAAPPTGVDPDGPMAEWYRSLKAPDIGGSCCSIADCRPVEARQVGNHWEVLTETGWQSVLPQRNLAPIEFGWSPHRVPNLRRNTLLCPASRRVIAELLVG